MSKTSSEIAERYGEPFARAFATFVLELEKSVAVERPSSVDRLAPGGTDDHEDDDFLDVTSNAVTQGIAARLRRIIKKRGLTQKELAKKLGVSPARISNVLKNPDRSKVDTLRKITDALDIELREML